MEPEINKNQTSNYSTPIAIILAGVIIAGVIYFTESKKVIVPEKILNQTNSTLIEKVKIDGEPFVGNPNATVVIAEWFDYQCPACQYADQNMITPLVADFVKAGKLKIVFKDFAFLGHDSQTLALTARAIWEAYPEKFYEWHKTMFENQGKENTGWATKDVITSITKKVSGIDMTVIDGLLAKNSVKYQSAVDADKAEGVNFGVNATPSFIIGNELNSGVPQYSDVKAIIDNLLK